MKPEISDEENALILEALEGEPPWMAVAYKVALAQGCRLKEISFNIHEDVDLGAGKITFHAKQEDVFTTKLVPSNRDLREQGKVRSWDHFGNASREWTRLFRKLGPGHLCFHSTRVTAITKCARKGFPLAQALRFFGRASSSVHEIYQKAVS